MFAKINFVVIKKLVLIPNLSILNHSSYNMVNQDPINVASDFFIFFKKGNESSGIYQECHSLAFPLALLDLDVYLVYSTKKGKEKPL